MKISEDKIKKLDMLNNTLTTKQTQLFAELLEVTPPSDIIDSYSLLKDIVYNYKNRLYGK